MSTFRPDPKPSTFRSKKLRLVVRSLPCVDCGADNGTIVGAHSNQGKGLSIKASDAGIMSLCHACHSRLDQPGLGALSQADRRDYEVRMNHRTLVALVESGILHT